MDTEVADQPTTKPTIRVSVAIVEAHQPTRDHLVTLLGNGGTPFGSMADLASRLTGNVPVVMVLGPSCNNPTDLIAAERVVQANPNLGAVLIAEQSDRATLQVALRSGIRDVIEMGNEAAELSDAVRRVALTLDVNAGQRSQQVPAAGTGSQTQAPPRRDEGHEPPLAQPDYRGGQVGSEQVDHGWVGAGGPGPTGAPGGGYPGAGPGFETDASGGRLGKVISIFSTKGGAGKSVLATSLAVALSQRGAGPVCLVDADLQFGDVAVMLKLTPRHTIVDAVAALDRLDPNYLDQLLMTHEPSGLRVLPAPLEPAFADQIGAAEMVQIVEMLRTFCPVVVVDTPAYFNDVVLGLVEISDEILLMAGMDIPNIKNVKIGLQTLRLLGTPLEKVRLVLNRANSKVKLDVGEVERTLQLTADSLIPSDIVVPQAVNKGVPVVMHAPRSGVTKAINALADLVAPQPARR